MPIWIPPVERRRFKGLDMAHKTKATMPGRQCSTENKQQDQHTRPVAGGQRSGNAIFSASGTAPTAQLNHNLLISKQSSNLSLVSSKIVGCILSVGGTALQHTQYFPQWGECEPVAHTLFLRPSLGGVQILPLRSPVLARSNYHQGFKIRAGVQNLRSPVLGRSNIECRGQRNFAPAVFTHDFVDLTYTKNVGQTPDLAFAQPFGSTREFIIDFKLERTLNQVCSARSNSAVYISSFLSMPYTAIKSIASFSFSGSLRLGGVKIPFIFRLIRAFLCLHKTPFSPAAQLHFMTKGPVSLDTDTMYTSIPELLVAKNSNFILTFHVVELDQLLDSIPSFCNFSRQASLTHELNWPCPAAALICSSRSSSKRMIFLVLFERSVLFLPLLSCIGSYHYVSVRFVGMNHSICEYHKKQRPVVLVTHTGRLTKPLIGVTVMADKQHTQTRQEFIRPKHVNHAEKAIAQIVHAKAILALIASQDTNSAAVENALEAVTEMLERAEEELAEVRHA